MSSDYEPREGIDYIVDLYAVVGAEKDVESAELKSLLNERTREYHPDRLEGLAPEFQSRGERMAILLNRARNILLDPQRRAEYDAILKEWDGPISDNGTPVISIDSYTKAVATNLSPDEIEASFASQRNKLVGMIGYKPGRLKLLERVITQTPGELPDDLREEYEEALLETDRVLAIQEAERAKLLGIDIEKRRYEAKLGYGTFVAGEIETSRATEQERLHMIALGKVPTRLALLAGEVASGVYDSNNLPARPEDVQLPPYFDLQAEKVRELAKEREEILERRLANFKVEYPFAELQTNGFDTVMVGILMNDTTTWLCAHYDEESGGVSTIDINQQTREALDNGQFEKVITAGKNVLTFVPLEQIDLRTLIDEALNKHFNKYPGPWTEAD